MAIDGHQGEFNHHRQADGLLLQHESGAAGNRDRQLARESCSDGRARGCDFVFGLEGLDAEMVMARHLVENIAGGSNGVGAEKDRIVQLFAGGDNAPRQSGVARDVPVIAGFDLCRGNRVAVS